MIQRSIEYIINLVKGLWSLLVGLAVTGEFLVRKKITVHYPRQVVPKEASDTFRGPIELVGSVKDPSVPRCISCMLCVAACPSGCITVVKNKPPKLTPEQEAEFAEAEARGETVKRPAAPKNPAAYEYDFTYCSLCACCVEVCPVDSIRFSNELYLAGTSRDDFKYDLLSRLERKAKQDPKAASELLPGPLGTKKVISARPDTVPASPDAENAPDARANNTSEVSA